MRSREPTPQSVTNRPRDDRRLAQLLGESGMIRQQPREEPSRLGLLAIGVLLGILFCLAFGVWQAAHRVAPESGIVPANDSTQPAKGVAR